MSSNNPKRNINNIGQPKSNAYFKLIHINIFIKLLLCLRVTSSVKRFTNNNKNTNTNISVRVGNICVLKVVPQESFAKTSIAHIHKHTGNILQNVRTNFMFKITQEVIRVNILFELYQSIAALNLFYSL